MEKSLLNKFPESAIAWKEITGQSLSGLLLKEKISLVEKKALALGLRCYWAGLPLSYLTGETCFAGRVFKVRPGVFLPRQESEILLEAAIKEIPFNSRILEIGTGTGAIIVSLLLSRTDLEGVGLDVSSEAVALTCENANFYRLGCRLKVINQDFKSFKGEKFEAVITNPPYISSYEIMALPFSVRYYEPRVALDGGNSGLEFYEKLSVKINELLLPGGLMLVEVGKRQSDMVKEIFASFMNWEKSFYDGLGIERVLLFRLK